MINKHKLNKIKENSNTVRHLNNRTDHRHSKSRCDQSSPARRTMIAAHLSGITNVKKFFIVIINVMHKLGQYNLVRLIVMYAFMRNCSFQICLHMHPKSFDAGLTVWLNFENVLLTFKWYVFMWQKCSVLTKNANCHFFNKWKCVSMP